MSSMFISYEPEAVQQLTTLANPSSTSYVQNLAYLCWTMGAACINDADPFKVINRCQCFKDIPFNELFIKTESMEPDRHYMLVKPNNKVRIIEYDYVRIEPGDVIYELSRVHINTERDETLNPEFDVKEYNYIQPLEYLVSNTLKFYYNESTPIETINVKYVPCDVINDTIWVNGYALYTIFYNEVCD